MIEPSSCCGTEFSYEY